MSGLAFLTLGVYYHPCLCGLSFAEETIWLGVVMRLPFSISLVELILARVTLIWLSDFPNCSATSYFICDSFLALGTVNRCEPYAGIWKDLTGE